MEAFWAKQVFVLRTMVFVFRQIYGKANSAGCLENDFCYAGKTLPPSRSRIDARIFDAQLMSCCNLREYLPAKKDIKEFKNINEAQDALPPAGFGAGVFADEDNEEDVPRNAEMFEAASILSAMQVPSAGTRTPCAVECARLPASCTLLLRQGLLRAAALDAVRHHLVELEACRRKHACKLLRRPARAAVCLLHTSAATLIVVRCCCRCGGASSYLCMSHTLALLLSILYVSRCLCV